MRHTRRFTAWGIGLLAIGLGIMAVWGRPLQGATVRSSDLQDQVKALTDRVQELEAKLACMTKDGDERSESTRLNSSHSRASRMPSSA